MKIIYISGYDNLNKSDINIIKNNIIIKGNIFCSTIEECTDVLIPHDLRYHPCTQFDEDMAKKLGKNIIHERSL